MVPLLVISGVRRQDCLIIILYFVCSSGEVDTRFSFCALACLALLGHLDAVNVPKAVEFVLSCMNFDGGFGSMPGSESHSGQVHVVYLCCSLWSFCSQVYCCVGALAVAGSLHHIDADRLGWWLSERQLPSGGLNGMSIVGMY